MVGTHWQAFMVFGSIALGWFMFWSLETRTYIIGDSIGAWYWHGNANSGNNVMRATKNGAV